MTDTAENGSFSTVAHLNAVALASSAHDRAAPMSRLWSHVRNKFPELRNATQFYAYDVARASKIAVESAVTSAASAIQQASPVVGSVPPAIRDISHFAAVQAQFSSSQWQSEVHYNPVPSSNSVGLHVETVELQSVPGAAGGVFLVVRLQNVGYAVFEVNDTGVFELASDLTSRGQDIPLVQVIDKDLGIVVLHPSARRLERVSLRQCAEEISWRSVELPASVTTPCGIKVVGKTHVLVADRNYFQIHVLSLATDPSASEPKALLGDAGLLYATSQTLVAYCSLPDDALVASTHTGYSARTSESAMHSVAKNIGSLTKFIWGTTPQATAQAQPLGAISLFDVTLGNHVGSFSPHNHTIAALAFSSDGTLLATASENGTTINIFQILRSSNMKSGAVETVHINLLSRLFRGITKASVCSVAFGPLNQYVAVGTSLGTCHVFHIPDATLQHRGAASLSSSFAAEQLSALSRVRSAPCASPVIPKVAFASWCPLDQSSCCTLVVVSAQSVVTVVRCSPDGLAPQYSVYLDNFRGQPSGELSPNSSLSCVELPQSSEGRELLHLMCNAQVEWETHDRFSPLETFCFDGASIARTDDPSHSHEQPDSPDSPHDWDVCIEVESGRLPATTHEIGSEDWMED